MRHRTVAFPIRAQAARRRPEHTGVYVHFPYCIQKCNYCDFYSVGMDRLNGARTVTPELLDRFRAGIRREFHQRMQSGDYRTFGAVNTVFFGGGTASLLPPELIAELLALFQSELPFTPDVEITLEGNPENFTPGYLRAVRDTGVNRINAGIQTFRGDLLTQAHRYYDAERYARILEDLSGSGIPRIGVDLIYGFPGQTRADFEADLERCLRANPAHLSVYSLTVEENTPYAAQVQKGELAEPLEELQTEIFQTLPAQLARQGLFHYEVSNFARPGQDCRHNLRYWLYESYLGLGPGAHGFDGRQRYGNPRSVAQWERQPAGAPRTQHDPLTELPLLYLRLCDGIEPGFFEQVLCAEYGFTPDVAALAHTYLERWNLAGYGHWRDDAFVWNAAGLLQLDDRVRELSGALNAEALPARES